MLNFRIKILWLKNTLGIAVDQIYSQKRVPITSYYFWPRNDAWELIRLEINSKPWITEDDKTAILNQITQILNSWIKNTENSSFENLSSQYEGLDLAGM